MRVSRAFPLAVFMLLGATVISAPQLSLPGDWTGIFSARAGGAQDQAALAEKVAELRQAGKTAEALTAARRALDSAIQNEGRDSRAAAQAMTTVAELYVETGNNAEAEPLFRRALEILQASGAGADEIAAVEKQLAQVREAQGRTAPMRTARRAARRGLTARPEPQPEVQARRTLAPPSPAEAGAPEWDVMPIYYGTDRGEEPNEKRAAYGSDRGHRLDLGRALVTIPKSHQIPEVERPYALHIPYFDIVIYEETEDPAKHFTLQQVKRLSKADFLSLVRERLASSTRFKDHATVFVHGYNTSFDNALYRAAQIAYDMEFDGVPFVYSWPSGGAVTSYTYDRESAEGARPHLRAFLDMVVKETGAKSISIIAHSMGNQAVLNVLREFNASPGSDAVISQLILAAPDVDIDNFANMAKSIEGLSRGVTLYASANDRALLVSRNFWGSYRAGDVPASGPIVLPGIETIDVTAASTDIFALNHSGFAQNETLVKDMGKLIEGDVHPPDARSDKIEPVNSPKGGYWRLSP
ncbi:MAG: alpha/beta hydrolase [Hyphomicrobium sp.]